MSLRVQFKRGTSQYIMNHTFDDGEIVINTDTKSIHVGDGTTLGGHEIPSKDYIDENFLKIGDTDTIDDENPVDIASLQSDLWKYSTELNYTVGSFVIYNNSIYQCIVANGPASTIANPSNVVYWSQIPTLADLETLVVPTGTVLLYAGSVLPQGYLGCQGAPFDPITYEKLYNRIGTTYGGTAQSPLLPDFRDRYPIGAGTNALGTYIAEQLPNITGTGDPVMHTGGGTWDVYLDWDGTGAISSQLISSSSEGLNTNGSGFNVRQLLTFNAKSSNSTYTDSGKVYPLSLALNFIIKA